MILYNKSKNNELLNESVDPNAHGYFVLYRYPGDSISDYTADIIVLADSEKEALDLASKYVDAGYGFEIDRIRGDHGKLKNYGAYLDKYKNSNLLVVGKNGIINEAGVTNSILGQKEESGMLGESVDLDKVKFNQVKPGTIISTTTKGMTDAPKKVDQQFRIGPMILTLKSIKGDQLEAKVDSNEYYLKEDVDTKFTGLSNNDTAKASSNSSYLDEDNNKDLMNFKSLDQAVNYLKNNRIKSFIMYGNDNGTCGVLQEAVSMNTNSKRSYQELVKANKSDSNSNATDLEIGRAVWQELYKNSVIKMAKELDVYPEDISKCVEKWLSSHR